jgi:hypothetical protein
MFDVIFNLGRLVGLTFLLLMILAPQFAIMLTRSSALVLFPNFLDRHPKLVRTLVRIGGGLALLLYLRPYVRVWLQSA